MVKTKISKHSKKLAVEIDRALDVSPLVYVDLDEYAMESNVTLRSAQRHIKDVPEKKFMKLTTYGNKRYFCRHDFDLGDDDLEDLKFGHLHSSKNNARVLNTTNKNDSKNDRKYPLYAAMGSSKQQNNPLYTGETAFVASENDTLSLYIYILLRDIKNKNSVSFLPENDSKNDKTPETTEINDTSQATSEDASGAFGSLRSMVCYAIKRNALFIDADEEILFEKMFKAGCTSDQVYRRYTRETRPNYWYNEHWKGKKNAAPTIKDIMDTWEFAKEYEPSAVDRFPPYNEIVATFVQVMQKHQRKSKAAMEELATFGYDEIVNHVPGGYYKMTISSAEENRIQIARALKLLREKTE